MDRNPIYWWRQIVGRSAARRLMTLALLATLSLWAIGAPSADAATIIVTTTDDENNIDGDCSLREAIRAANSNIAVDACTAGNGYDTINLPAGIYTFDPALGAPGEGLAATGDLDIRDDLTLKGEGRANTIIDGNGLDRVIEIGSASVTIAGVTIRNGNSQEENGGAIWVVTGGLTLLNSRVTGSTTGITDFRNGGGLAYISDDEPLRLMNSRVDHNTSTSSGGGIYIDSDSEAFITISTIEDNSAGSGGGIRNDGTATISHSLIADNFGTSSTSGGGGLSNNGPLSMINSTVSGNRTVNSGGGISTGSGNLMKLYNVTITDNTANSDGNFQGEGGGIRIASGSVILRNTIIAGNIANPEIDKSSFTSASAAGDGPDCSGTGFISEDYNLIGDMSGCIMSGIQTHNLTGVNPKLLPLRGNGGPTATHALQSGSPAIDAGNPDGCLDELDEKLTVDQRGYVRPVNGVGALDINCDIGAFEYLSPGPPTPTPTFTPTHTPPPTNTPTVTNTVTPGPSPTASATASPTSTATEGPSPTPTATATPSSTPTEGPSPTPSATATDGPSPTPTATATDGPSPTPTATATIGPSPTPFVPTDRIYLPISLFN